MAAQYSKAHRALELFGVVAAYTMVVALLVSFVVLVKDAYSVDVGRANWLLFVLLSAAAIGYLFADFMSGVIHWAFDRFGTVKTPLLGENFVRPFRFHHVDPKDITRHDFLETNGNNCIVTVPVLAFLLFGPFTLTHAGQLFGVAMITFAAIFTFATNQFHKWAHYDEPPAFVVWLQDHGLILGRAHHKIHHTFPYESHYCITTGWLNKPLVAIGFWRRSEWVLENIFKMTAHRDPAPVEMTEAELASTPDSTSSAAA